VPTFRAVTDETSKTAESATKVATAIGSNIPVLAETKSLTVEYGGVIEDKVVTAQMRANLEQQYMNGEAQKLIDTANEQAETIGKSGIAIRQNELNQKQFNVSQQAAIINAESALAYAEEEANLRKEMVAVKSPGLAAQYAAGLSDKTLTKDQIESLTGQKLQIEFTKNITELDGRAEKATLTAEAYQRLTLARDGFTESQINGQMAWQQEVIKLEDAAEANSRIAQSFESDLAGALKNGEFNFQNFADTVISEITRLQVIKPLMESLFGADKSGKSGLFGDSEGGIVQTIGSFLGFANGGAFAASGVQEYANGGAFHNSVLNKPTQFFANGGLAVAGEAGSEAVMPLTRIGGKLGVQSTGTGVVVQPQIKINIVNNAGAKVETQQQTDNDGNINMTVMINQIEGAISDRARRGQGLANVFKRVS
jgi:lambda family phage tail tape measure protein